MKILISTILTLIFASQMNGQLTVLGDSLLFGPLVGSVTATETSIFFLVEKGSENAQFSIQLEDVGTTSVELPNSIKSFCQGDICGYVATFNDLEEESLLDAVLYKGNVLAGRSWRPFQIPSAMVSDFSFLLGSCARMPNYPNSPDWAREAIYGKMASEDAQFMLWLGDNLYLPSTDLDTSTVLIRTLITEHKALAETNF